ncbi:ABC-2 family transporter protein [uncultured archaeon]|nr:ABC-2 family transporter protein [uncultured archaeon]
MRSLISGFLSLVVNETKRLIKGFLPSYAWFGVLVFISAYALFAQEYINMSIGRSLITLNYPNNPMTEVLLYIVSFAVKSSSDVLAGNVPKMVFPVSIGVIFFLLFPYLLSLTLMGNQIIKKACTTISGEEEKKTLFVMASSPQTRQSIFIAKFTGLLLLALPMIILFYFITNWVFTSRFSSAFNPSVLVLEMLFINAVLFASAGMFLSVIFNNGKKAAWAGTKLVTVTAALTTLWIMIPFMEFVLNLTNNSTDYLMYLEKLTWYSPFTLELMSVYDPSLFAGHFIILTAASAALFIPGMVIFIRKDLEY